MVRVKLRCEWLLISDRICNVLQFQLYKIRIMVIVANIGITVC